LSKKIFYIRIDNHHGAQPVPQVIQGKKSFSVVPTGLVFGLDKGAAQLYSIRKVVFFEFFGKLKQVGRGKIQLPRMVYAGISAMNKPVSRNNFLFDRIPGDQLIIAVIPSVILIDIQWLAGSSPGLPEGQFPEPADFLNYMWGIMMVDQKNLVDAVVDMADKPFLRQFLP